MRAFSLHTPWRKFEGQHRLLTKEARAVHYCKEIPFHRTAPETGRASGRAGEWGLLVSYVRSHPPCKGRRCNSLYECKSGGVILLFANANFLYSDASRNSKNARFQPLFGSKPEQDPESSHFCPFSANFQNPLPSAASRESFQPSTFNLHPSSVATLTFRGDGRAGQLCVVIPEEDAVVAITADSNSFQIEMNAIWDHLLPRFGADALPADAAAQKKLKQAVANLVAHPPPAKK